MEFTQEEKESIENIGQNLEDKMRGEK